MALIPCPECGREISDRAAVCPGCGFPLNASAVVPASANALALPSSVEQIPAPRGEEILAQARPSFFGSAPGLVILGVLLTPMLLGLLILLAHFLDCRSQLLTVTTARVSFRRGLLSLRTHELRLRDVRSIAVSRTFLERLLGTGTVEVSSAASDAAIIRAAGIGNPDGIADLIRGHMGQ